jgi:subtilisin family serine protease
MDVLSLINLRPLMDRTSGRTDVMVGLIDGPVAVDHPDLEHRSLQVSSSRFAAACSVPDSRACAHGTFVAGILCAKRGSLAPSICPDCTIVISPIFEETVATDGNAPLATAEDLAEAIIRVTEMGAKVINLSVEVVSPSAQEKLILTEALNFAGRRGVICVAAAGNQGLVAGTSITCHECVIPVVGFDRSARPLKDTNLGRSVGQSGIGAPGDAVVSLGPNHRPLELSGSSVAAPFVTGAIALLLSEFPRATPTDVKLAVLHAGGQRRRGVVPPLLDAWTAFHIVSNKQRG